MDHMPWMLGGKMRVRGYLEELNKEKKARFFNDCLLCPCVKINDCGTRSWNIHSSTQAYL